MGDALVEFSVGVWGLWVWVGRMRECGSGGVVGVGRADVGVWGLWVWVGRMRVVGGVGRANEGSVGADEGGVGVGCGWGG